MPFPPSAPDIGLLLHGLKCVFQAKASSLVCPPEAGLCWHKRCLGLGAAITGFIIVISTNAQAREVGQPGKILIKATSRDFCGGQRWPGLWHPSGLAAWGRRRGGQQQDAVPSPSQRGHTGNKLTALFPQSNTCQDFCFHITAHPAHISMLGQPRLPAPMKTSLSGRNLELPGDQRFGAKAGQMWPGMEERAEPMQETTLQVTAPP